MSSIFFLARAFQIVTLSALLVLTTTGFSYGNAAVSIADSLRFNKPDNGGASDFLPGLRSPAATVVVQWNQVLRDCIAATNTPPTVAARASSMMHEAIYNAWSYYDRKATPTLSGFPKQNSHGHLANDKAAAISYSAYQTLLDLFPSQQPRLDEKMGRLALAVGGTDQPLPSPAGVGQLAARLLLERRHRDGSNQLGDLAPGRYTDYTGYKPLNHDGIMVDPIRWQALIITPPSGLPFSQKCLTPHWGLVKPFALASGSAFRPAPPASWDSDVIKREMAELIHISAGLTDRQKVIAEYWAGGPSTETPPGQWTAITEFVSLRDRNSLDEDVKLFFAVSQALLDASIAAWDAKVAFDYARPISAIREAYKQHSIQAWAGPELGTRWISGRDWIPYQELDFVTPPFPEYVSGHSCFSAAAAQVIRSFTRGDKFNAAVNVPPMSSTIERYTPRSTVSLTWATFSEAAEQAGLSRRYGGIHFASGDLAGRRLGRRIGELVWEKCNAYFEGKVKLKPMSD